MNWLQNFFAFDMTNSQSVIGIYNYWLVLLSIVLASAASFFSLHFASVAQHIVIKKYKQIALVSGSFVMAGGIWSMHFVGMLAYNMGHAITYDPWLTLLSIIPSIIASYITLYMLIKDKLSLWQLVMSGTLVGLGIGTMHYMGMAAMEMDMTLRYEPFWFALSILVAVGLAIVALSTRYYIKVIRPDLNENITNSISALIMGGAISGMHYTGMTAALYLPNANGISHMALMKDTSNDYFSLSVAVVTLLVSILATNITSQLRYRQLLLEKTSNELRLKTTLDNAVDGIITIDHTGLIQAFNKSAISIFGWQEKEVVGKHISMMMPESYQNECDAFFLNSQKESAKEAVVIDQEITALHKDGHTFPIRLGVGQVKIEDFSPIFVAFVTDISIRREMANKIRKSEEQYSSLIKNIPGASFRYRFGEDWDLMFISDAIKELSGWEVQDFLDKNTSLPSLMHEEDNEKVSKVFHEAKKGHHAYTVEYRLKHKEGHYIWVLENGSIVWDENNQPQWVDGVILDISQRIKMEDDLRQEKIKAEQSAESKSAFLANMSHEIRTPMNAIIGFSDILLDSDMPLEHKKHLSTISKSGRSLLHLLNDILDSAKLDKNKLDLDEYVFDLMNMVDTVISTLWLQAKNKNVELSFIIEESVSRTYFGAEARIHQVLMNLLGNAIKFTEAGNVTLTISKQDNEHVRFSIQDTGIGIPSERLEHIFEPFTQADASMSRRFGGTGLGTTISKQLVELMGGQIHASSEVNVGSCFYVDLPLKESNSIPINESKTTALTLPSKTILIADDVEQNVTLLTLILQRQGHKIYTANNGSEAVTVFKNIKPDIILMDIQMPVMDGLTATQIIRDHEKNSHLSHTPIIALTANVQLEDKLEAQKAGMDGFANKPIDVSALTLEMARVLNIETIEHMPIDKTEDALEDINKKQIHFEKGLELWGEKDTYLAELNRFFELNKTLPNTLFSHIESKEFDLTSSLAHAIKGTSSNLALVQITQLAARIENSARAQDGAVCINAIQQLESDIKSVYQELQDLNNIYQIEATNNKEIIIMASSKELLTMIEELLALSKAGEIDDQKVDIFVASIQANMKNNAIDIKNALLDFDFSTAIATLSDIKIAIEGEV